MPKDKYTATWVSHSSITDFLNCPRSYYLKNVYKDPKTNHKIQLTSPALTLGSTVHEVLESLSIIPTGIRFNKNLLDSFEKIWQKNTGKRGGFINRELEEEYKDRGREMLKRVMTNPGPLKNLAVKIKKDLPYYFISEEFNIILCGKIDWLEYLQDQDGVHIIDFKTSKKEEDEKSLQLPIYHLLVHNCQQRKALKASYWYLSFSDNLIEKKLPDLNEANDQILAIAKKIKTARALQHFKCPHGDKGCFFCQPFEKILQGGAERVGVNQYGQDIYMINSTSNREDDLASDIL